MSLRRVMRRAIRHGHRLGIQKPFLHEVALEVVRLMGEHYPELITYKDTIASIAEQEEVRFRETIERGLKLLDEEINSMRAKGVTTIDGRTAFKLYDTFGFPLDLTEVIAKERDLSVDVIGYNEALEEQRERSEGSKLNDSKALDAALYELSQKIPEGTRFLGYERESAQGKVLAIVKEGVSVEQANAGETVSIITDETPFYGESGGQVGDTGTLKGTAGSLLAATVSRRAEAARRPICAYYTYRCRHYLGRGSCRARCGLGSPQCDAPQSFRHPPPSLRAAQGPR